MGDREHVVFIACLCLAAACVFGLGVWANRPEPPPPDQRIERLAERIAALEHDRDLFQAAQERDRALFMADIAQIKAEVEMLKLRQARLEAVVPVQAIRDRARVK